jgi:hypothetical protein
MTAIIVILQSRAVHMLTDGAAILPGGALHFRAQKTFPILALSGAVAARGPAFLPVTFALHASIKADSFDKLKSISSLVARSALSETPGATTETAFDLVIAGWSETAGPCAYLICNHERYGAKAPPWQVTELGPISLLPNDEAIAAELQVAFPKGANPDELDPVADGLRILEIQRKHTVDHAGDFGTVRAVGGFAQLTTIKQDAIDMRIIRRWPDELGKVLAGATLSANNDPHLVMRDS